MKLRNLAGVDALGLGLGRLLALDDLGRCRALLVLDLDWGVGLRWSGALAGLGGFCGMKRDQQSVRGSVDDMIDICPPGR
jgi:hypothetical protein